jgi:hypothetical protein
LIKLYNGIIKLKIKAAEIKLIKKFPEIIGNPYLDEFFKENIE